ncbi:MAG TPA: DUF697 domain-containing protein, partial [Rhizobiales bacterium]|nr:DUF697 domain-containing protein [Hyphomicrobiales bacterium]
MTPRKPAAFRLPPQDREPARQPHGAATKQHKPTASANGDKITITPLPEEDSDTANIAPVPRRGRPERQMRWGLILISALFALLSMGIGLWATQIVSTLLSSHPWLGWTASALLALAALAALILAGREIIALLRQRRIGRIHSEAKAALLEDNPDKARQVQSALTRLYGEREDAAWGLVRIGEHDGDILDAEARLHLVERELMTPLDRQARTLVASTAKRISILTAISPSAIVDIAFVAALNLRLLRSISTLYGGRPGAFGLLRLARMVLTHLVLTGGIALGE